MDKREYRKELSDPRWLKKRKEILLLDKYRCRNCGKENVPLNVHHLVYVEGRHAWEYYNDQLITLCERCHFLLHNEEKKYDMGARIGQVYERHHSDWTYSALCYFVDYINRLVYLIGTDTSSNWDSVRQEIVSFDYFRDRFHHCENFFLRDKIETYNAELLTKGLFYFMDKNRIISLHLDGYEDTDEEQLRSDLHSAFKENDALHNNYISFCNDRFYFENM